LTTPRHPHEDLSQSSEASQTTGGDGCGNLKLERAGLPKYTCTSRTAACDAVPMWFFVILDIFFDVLSLPHPLTTMLFFMQDFENPAVGLATGWSHVAVHNTNPRVCKNGEGTGKERKHPIQQFMGSFGISILHSAARDFHQDGLGTIRIPVEPSRSPAIQVSSSTQVEQVALCPSYRQQLSARRILAPLSTKIIQFTLPLLFL